LLLIDDDTSDAYWLAGIDRNVVEASVCFQKSRNLARRGDVRSHIRAADAVLHRLANRRANLDQLGKDLDARLPAGIIANCCAQLVPLFYPRCLDNDLAHEW